MHLFTLEEQVTGEGKENCRGRITHFLHRAPVLLWVVPAEHCTQQSSILTLAFRSREYMLPANLTRRNLSAKRSHFPPW